MALHDKVLLISNSTVHGRGYLDHVESEIKSFLGGAGRVLFFPFALHDWGAYTATAKKRFEVMGYSLDSAHQTSVPRKAVEETDAIFIGGGNTFRLLKALEDLNLIEAIRRKVNSGAPYIGSSAGSNVAGPTIKTTKDMPIVQPRSFDSLGLVPFRLVLTISIPTRIPLTWERPRKNEFCNFSKKMTHQSWPFAKEPGCCAMRAPSH
jgi:dipeptidase E